MSFKRTICTWTVSCHKSSEEKSFVCLLYQETRFDQCQNMTVHQLPKRIFPTVKPTCCQTPFVTTVPRETFPGCCIKCWLCLPNTQGLFICLLCHFFMCSVEAQCCYTRYGGGAGSQFVLMQRCNDIAYLVPPQPWEQSDLCLCIFDGIWTLYEDSDPSGANRVRTT